MWYLWDTTARHSYLAGGSTCLWRDQICRHLANRSNCLCVRQLVTPFHWAGKTNQHRKYLLLPAEAPYLCLSLDPRGTDYLHSQRRATIGPYLLAETQHGRLCRATAFGLTTGQPLPGPARPKRTIVLRGKHRIKSNGRADLSGDGLKCVSIGS